MADTLTPSQPRTAPRLRRPGPWTIANIVDGRALRAQLTAAAHTAIGNPDEQRRQALDILHRALFRGRMIAQERLEQGADGLDTARLLAAVQDEVITALYDFIVSHVYFAGVPTDGERIAICATGGYGRSVLAPSSDIDLLILTPQRKNAHAESVLEYMLYALWDMGLKVGNAFRTIDECIRLSREDVTIRTSILDARFLCGDRAQFALLGKRFQADCVRGREADFIADKLAERNKRHARQFLDDWIARANASGVAMLKRFAKTLMLHRTGLLAWYDATISTGPLEGTNNKIKTMQRQAYGYRDQEFFRMKIFAIHETKYALVG